jgi:PIN domain nuclease of toxin-antitoxin system
VRLLLDTHALLWWLSDDPTLGAKARDLIADPANDVAVSTASLWELVIKARIGKLEADITEVERAIDQEGFQRLGIEPEHLAELARLPTHHRDPFDHLLIAQARSEKLQLISADRHFAAYEVELIGC